MRAGFIITSGKQNFEPFKDQPLGVLYLQTILEKEFGSRLEISLIDLRGVDPKNAIYLVPEKDIYMYSLTTLDYNDTESIISQIQKAYPEAKHIGGGPHVEIFPARSHELFDAISLGEGEESIKRIVNDAFLGKLKKVYRQEREIDLNAYPHASRKYLAKTAVVGKGILNKKYPDSKGTTVLFSRGCPFKCHFCSNPNFGRTRFRSPGLILEEIKYLKKEYAIEALAIKDDNSIPVNRNIARPYLEAIAKANIKWRGQTRANGIQRDMIRLARQSGCIEVAVGIESISGKVLEIINKKIDLPDAKRYLNELKKEGIDRKLLLILGLPGEPKDIAGRTIEFIKEVEPSSVLLSLFCPLPGSEMHTNPRRFGMKIRQDASFDDYKTAVGRFDKEEKANPVFEYDKETPFGRGKSRSEILDDHAKVQSFLRQNGMIF